MLDAVLDALEGAQHAANRLSLDAREVRHRRRRERVLDVVRPLDAKLRRRHERDLLAAPAQDELVAQEQSALFEGLPAAEKKYGARGTLLHRARPLVVVVQDEPIACCHFAEKPFLHRLIDFHRAVALDVVGRHVEDGGDLRTEVLRRLHLVARNLGGDCAALARLQHGFRQRIADVAADARLLLAELLGEQQPQERRRRRLAVRPRHGEDRRLGKCRRQFHFARDADAAPLRLLGERDGDGNGGREHEKIAAVQERGFLCAENQPDAECAKLRDVFFDRRLVLRIGKRDLRAEPLENLRRRKAADPSADDENLLSFEIRIEMQYASSSLYLFPADEGGFPRCQTSARVNMQDMRRAPQRRRRRAKTYGRRASPATP